MKKPTKEKLYCSPGIKYLGACLGVTGALLAANLNATNIYFDLNGTTSGFGAGSGNYSWDAAYWSTSSAGTTTPGNWVAGDFPYFKATGSYSVTVNNSESLAGMFLDVTGTTLTITNAGSGNLSVTSGVQGFLTDGSTSTLVLACPVTGTGGVEAENGGSLFLAGNNTFSGGFIFGTLGGVNINNNNSFGTGPISWGVAEQILADTNGNGLPTAHGPLTIPNGVTTISAAYPGDQLIVVTAPTNAITFAGPWTNAAGGYSRLTMNTVGTIMTIGGTVYGSGNLFKDGAGRLILNGVDNNGATIVTTNGVFEIGANGVFNGTLYVTNTAAQLQLDSTNSLAPTTTLLVAGVSNNAVNLNFSGTNVLFSLSINGVTQPPGTYGSLTSTAQYQNAVFTGSGVLSTPPAVLQQPVSIWAYPGQSATFNVQVAGNFNFQWYSNGVILPGQNGSSLTINPVLTNSGATYSVTESALGTNNSATATLNVVPTDYYTDTIISNGPIAYWRLDETSGTVAYDSVSTNEGAYVNVSLNQPGFSLTDPDPCIGMPVNTNARGYMVVSNAGNFNFTAAPYTTQFTLEAWAKFTNITGVARLISTLGNGTGWAFGIKDATDLRFTQGSVQDADLALTNVSISTGVWYYFAMTYDGANYNFFVNGVLAGSVVPTGHGNALTGALTVGSDPPAYTYTPEQVYGNVDEVAIYTTALSTNQIYQDYNARYGTLAPPVAAAPTVNPQTNYVSLTSEFQENAAGQALTYQWFMSPSTMLAGQTSSTLTLNNLTTGNAGSYYVQVSNPAGTNTSPATALTVLPIPTSSSQLNLTNGLVLHLPFNGNLTDISGNGYNGTAVGNISYVSPAAVGSNALQYSSAPGNFNYVTLGVQSALPLLQFGTSTNFTVSMWVQQPAGSTFTNLPFFTDEINSTSGSLGFAFAPYDGPYGGGNGGGWQWTLNGVSSPSQYAQGFNDSGIINDGNWHNLVFTANRQGNMTAFVDGQQADSQAINFLTTIDPLTNNVNIGQDPTGTYPVTAQANINDLAVWNTLLTPLQISGLYLGGASNRISFAPAVQVGPTYVPLTYQQVGGQWQLVWSVGNLQSATNLGSVGLYPNPTTVFTNVPGATSPYTIPTTQSPIFYRLHP